MDTILESDAIANLPVIELEAELRASLEPVLMHCRISDCGEWGSWRCKGSPTQLARCATPNMCGVSQSVDSAPWLSWSADLLCRRKGGGPCRGRFEVRTGRR